jgi:hypothetical protein
MVSPALAIPQTSHIVTQEEASFGFLPDLCSPKHHHHLHQQQNQSPSVSSIAV